MTKKFNLVSGISQLSYGLVGLNILKELSNRDYKVSLWPLGGIEAPIEDHDLIKESLNNARYYDCNSPSLRIWHQFSQDLHPGRQRVGFPIFELDQFNPNEHCHLSQLDKIVVCSQWAKNICIKNGLGAYQPDKEHVLQPTQSIHVVPLGVDTKIFNPNYTRIHNTKETVFGNIGKWEVRKGHDVLIECFNEAFTENDNVKLMMIPPNPFIGNGNQQWEQMYLDSKMGQVGKIEIIDKRLETQQDVVQLMNRVDCGVFPTRAEGWCLPALEFLAMGKQLIITNYSGQTEFCTKSNSLLIEHDNQMEDAIDGVFFHGDGGKWLEFTDNMKTQLVNHMRAVHKNKQFNHNGVKTSLQFSWSNTVDKLLEVYSE